MAKLEGLHDLFLEQLKDMYDSEKQIIKALPKMIKEAENAQLKRALEEHLEETRGHVERLERVFESVESKARGQHCPGMEGIIDEGKELLEKDAEPAVRDAGIIASAQRVEHYEMAAYGTLIAYAKDMGHREATTLLQQTLKEEEAADRKLTEISRSVNTDAMQPVGAH
jgi:ferritin-like metal-binding protein YciE